jgi:ubiquinone/menaquinone biosynthesis C-methylase UbiE
MLKEFIQRSVTNIGTQNDLTREVWVKQALSQLPANLRLLDVGAGQQRYRSSCSHLRYVSQDFCEYDGVGNGQAMQAGAWETSETDIVSDIKTIPAENESFDAILCSEVLEHVPDPIGALREFARLLRPRGMLILTAPFCSVTHMAPYHFYSGFNKYFYEHFLPPMGFTIVEITPNGNYSDYSAQELRRILSLYERVPFYIKASIVAVLRFLSMNRNSETANSDLLCYGYHVKAFKERRDSD